MLELYRRHNRQPRVIVPEIVIELIGLVHKVLALTQPIVDAETRYNGPYLAGWIERRIHQHQREHSCRGAFAMYSADRDHAFLLHQFAQHLLPGDQRYPSHPRSRQLWMIRVQHKRCRDNYQPVDPLQVIRAVTDLHRHTDTLQCARRRRCLHIASGHRYALATGLEHHLRHC